MTMTPGQRSHSREHAFSASARTPVFKRTPPRFAIRVALGAVTLAHGHSVQFPFSAMDSSKKRKESDVKDDKPAPQEAKRRPVQQFREDDVSVSIWAREHVVNGEARMFYSCTFERSYKNRDGVWRYTKTFDLYSLGKVVTLAQKAAEWIGNTMNEESSQ